MKDFATEVLIVGGGTGGVAAALAVARRGGRCVLTELTDWVGGQLTSQAVPPDENRWIEGLDGTQSATRSYLGYRQRVRQFYRDHRALTAEARNNPTLNPGAGWVSYLCHEPTIGHSVLQQMLAEHIAAGRIELRLRHEPVGAEVDGDRVRAVRLRNLETGDEVVIAAQYFIDATETGELLALAKVEYAVGAEHRDEHGEEHGRSDRAEAMDQQAISWCFAVEHRPGEDHVIAKPEKYDFWREYVPALDHAWPGRLFSWTVVGGEEHRAREFRFVPWPDEPQGNELEMWRYRRIVDRAIYQPESAVDHPDVSLINMVQMDYFQRPTLDVGREGQRQAFAEAKEQSLCFLYWMQTEAPRHDGSDRTGYPGLRLRGQELGTPDGFAKFPYIRESRRLKARVIVSEKHVSTEIRRGIVPASGQSSPYGSAEPFADSVGIGHYRLDLHPSTGMRGSIYVPAAPFRIPMGALIPVRVRNLLAGGKNLGVTHVTNGCYRLHPVEWNVGEAAGMLAEWCLRNGTEPQQVHGEMARVRAFQQLLKEQGVPLAWPWENGANL